MNFIAHRSLMEVDPSVIAGLAIKDDFQYQKLQRAVDAVEKFDWRNLQTACVNGTFGSIEAIDLQIRELGRFLVLKAITEEDGVTELAPSKCIERIWRLLILFSKDYRYLCDNILSDDIECRFIDHDPLDNMKEAKHVRYYNTISLYCKIFKEMPPLEVWPHPEPLKRRNSPDLSLLNKQAQSANTSTVSSKKRIRFSPEIEVKVYTTDSVSTSPPVAVNYFKPVSLQVTPTKHTSSPFTFETPTPPSAPQPSAFLLACQRVIKAAKQDGSSSPSGSRVRFTTESPPTLPMSIFTAMEITPQQTCSPPRQQITLRFIDMDNEDEKYDMNTKFGTSFKNILASYKKKRNVFTFRSVRYKGVEVNEEMSPNDLRMSSHDRIEVFGSISMNSLAASRVEVDGELSYVLKDTRIAVC